MTAKKTHTLVDIGSVVTRGIRETGERERRGKKEGKPKVKEGDKSRT